jgi:DNA mismatch endonuclease (patch repair protein)
MTSPSLRTDPATSVRMKRVRQRDTKPELILRAWLFRNGVRYTTRNKDLPGSPDIANRSKRWAIFVHGCFWHGHRGCGRSRLPKSNVDFWQEKITGNRRRDAAKARQLRSLGFMVCIFWECEVERLGIAPAKLQNLPFLKGHVLISPLSFRLHSRRPS